MDIRLGLCCLFRAAPVKFRHLTAKTLSKYPRNEQLLLLDEVAVHNARSLLEAVKTAYSLNIHAFRVMSQILPLYTHPEGGYRLEDLTHCREIKKYFAAIKQYAKKHDIRLSFHPDQFVILNSPRADVLSNSLQELSYQCMVAEFIGADAVNIHLGGVYGDKAAAIRRFEENFKSLPEVIKRHLALENDDISYTPQDLYPLCRMLHIPMTYDVHHHRCNPDDWSIETATEKSIDSWHQCGREPHFHISSPKNTWRSKNPRPHHDYIDIKDFPGCWCRLDMPFTLDVEAKAKELAVIKLAKQLHCG